MFSDDKGQSLTNTDLFAARLILDYVYLARPTVPNQGVDTFTHNTKVYTGLIWAGIALGRKGFLSSPVAFHFPHGMNPCLGSGLSRLPFSARQMGQSSAVLGLSGWSIFALGAVLAGNRTIAMYSSWLMQKIASKHRRITKR
jgi:hypothetical protein